MAQLGSASALGAEGRRFESGYPDQFTRDALCISGAPPGADRALSRAPDTTRDPCPPRVDSDDNAAARVDPKPLSRTNAHQCGPSSLMRVTSARRLTVNPLATRRARAYLRDCLGYLGIAALEVPLGLAVLRTPLASSSAFVAIVSSVPPVAATMLAARAEAGPRRATWGKRREQLTVEGTDGAPSLVRAVVRNSMKIGLPWTLGHVVVCRAMDGGFERGDPVTWAATAAVYGLGAVTVGLGLAGRGRTLHDLVAGTRVVASTPRNGPERCQPRE